MLSWKHETLSGSWKADVLSIHLEHEREMQQMRLDGKIKVRRTMTPTFRQVAQKVSTV